MKIKTVYQPLDTPRGERLDSFDNQVNALLADGWVLTDRKVIEAQSGAYIDVLYAELVLPDRKAEPEPITPAPALALRQIKEICEAVTDSCDNCPIKDWCFGPLKNGDDPTDWELPEVEA